VTIKCGKCGAASRDNAKFCSKCGIKLGDVVAGIACPKCGESAQPDDKFCGKCGAAMSPGAAGDAAVEKYDGPWRLTDVVREWIRLQEWDDKPELDEAEGTSVTGFGKEEEYRVFLDVDERHEVFRVFRYLDSLKIPAKRLGEANEAMRQLNLRNIIGRIQIVVEDDGESVVRYYHAIDVENASFEVNHIKNMLIAAKVRLELCLPQFAAICEGKSAEEALAGE
jgi:hypothetical protein